MLVRTGGGFARDTAVHHQALAILTTSVTRFALLILMLACRTLSPPLSSPRPLPPQAPLSPTLEPPQDLPGPSQLPGQLLPSQSQRTKTTVDRGCDPIVFSEDSDSDKEDEQGAAVTSVKTGKKRSGSKRQAAR